MHRVLVPLAEVEATWRWGTERYLRRCVEQRRIPFHRVRGRIYFDADDLDAHAEEARVDSVARAGLTDRQPRRLRAAR